MSQHDQSNVTVEAGPTPPLVMIKPQFPFGVLIKPFDNPADMRKLNQLFEVESVQIPGKIVFLILFANVFGDGTLTQKPAANRQVSAPIATSKHYWRRSGNQPK